MPTDYQVKNRDCINSIAFNHGFFWETLWNHGSNSELKSKRKDPNILKEGDAVHIPDLTLKQESGATEQRHRFKLKGVPAKLKLRVMRLKTDKKKKGSSSAAKGGAGAGGLGGLASSVPGLPGAGGGGGDDPNSKGADPDYEPPKNEEEPIKNAPYVFQVDGRWVAEGKTDGQGCVEIPLVPNAREGKLIVNRGDSEEKIVILDLGGMDPVEEVIGVRKRLRNLGFFCQAEGPADGPELQAALKNFQERNSLDVTGEADEATRNKLKEIHGS